MWFIELGLRTYFILKRGGFLTTAIFTGFTSTVHKSFKISLFGVSQAMIHAYQCCVFLMLSEGGEENPIYHAFAAPFNGTSNSNLRYVVFIELSRTVAGCSVRKYSQKNVKKSRQCTRQ